MIHHLGENNSLLNQFVSEIRDVGIQRDRLRFRRNIERIGEVIAYEISKTIPYRAGEVTTPLGKTRVSLPAEHPVLGTILRAGLPLHNGFLNYFDQSDNAFMSAYRHHLPNGGFEIKLEYFSSTSLDHKILIMADPMLATGSSMVLTLEQAFHYGKPREIHIACVIASRAGIRKVQEAFPEAVIWTTAIDEELNNKSYIVPGLGDAGDLAFGEKTQQ